jgi:hypothetical protein
MSLFESLKFFRIQQRISGFFLPILQLILKFFQRCRIFRISGRSPASRISRNLSTNLSDSTRIISRHGTCGDPRCIIVAGDPELSGSG